MTRPGRAIRILHVVGCMNRGGVETWLMHVLRHIDPEQFRFDFLVHTDQAGAYDEEIRRYGCEIISCPYVRRPLAYAQRFLSILHEHGPYDIVHCHTYHFSGYVLLLAHLAGVPVRIAHSHSAAGTGAGTSIVRRSYLAVAKGLINRHATHGLATSQAAAVSLFGENWMGDARWRLLFCGIDLEPFLPAVDRPSVAAELGIPSDALVVGHVGRFEHVKNHKFIVDIADSVLRKEPRAFFVLVGDGPLKPQIQKKVVDLGLEGRFLFVGARDDVPRLMKGVMDVFLLPSYYEGLGLSLIEAQAAGLPCVIADTIPTEAEIIKEAVVRLSLSKSADEWADAVLSRLQRRNSDIRLDDRIVNSPFNIEICTKTLCHLYRSAL